MKKYLSGVVIFLFICFQTGLVMGQNQAAPPEIQSDITIGKVYTHTSKIMDEEREFRVLLPASYESSEINYPVIYVLDGSAYYLSAFSSMKALSGDGSIPESIIVAVSSHNRENEMTPPYMQLRNAPNPKADKFLDYFEKELIPYVNQNYRTLPLRILMGHSHGGIFNIYALTERPELFRWHLVMDAPVHLQNRILEKKMIAFANDNPEHRGRVATTWSRFQWDRDNWSDLEAITSLTLQEFRLDNVTHSSMYHPGFYKGLKILFEDYAYTHDEILTFKELNSRYKKMTAEYGYEVPIPRQALTNGAMEYLIAGDAERAEPFVKTLKENYGSATFMRDDFEEWLNQLKEAPPKITRADYLLQKEASMEQVSKYMGTWAGGNGYVLEIKNENGKPAGVLRQSFPNGSVNENHISKFVVNEGGNLEVSHGNKMTPLSAISIYQLELVTDERLAVEKRDLLFWPRMERMIRPTQFEMVRKGGFQ